MIRIFEGLKDVVCPSISHLQLTLFTDLSDPSRRGHMLIIVIIKYNITCSAWLMQLPPHAIQLSLSFIELRFMSSFVVILHLSSEEEALPLQSVVRKVRCFHAIFLLQFPNCWRKSFRLTWNLYWMSNGCAVVKPWVEWASVEGQECKLIQVLRQFRRALTDYHYAIKIWIVLLPAVRI